MARLPKPGGDAGDWGEILNDFLSKAHAADGTLRPNAVSAGHIRNDSITKSKLSVALQQEIDAASSGSGQNGADGREVELNSSATHVQWRYVGSSTWTNLVALADITGPQGPQGQPGVDGADGTDGAQGPAGPGLATGGTTGQVLIKSSATNYDTEWVDAGAGGGTQGPKGDDGREVELRTGTTHVQWRYVGDTVWIDLTALADITGATGAKGDKGDQGDTGLQGPKGDKGDQGDPGATTISGITGLQTELDNRQIVVRWSGSSWPARPTGAAFGVLFLSTNDASAPEPTDANLASGDVWRRHPDAV